MIKNFGHAGNAGDTIAALPTLKTYYEKTGIKPILYLIKDHPTKYHHESVVHPVKNENGEHVSLNQNMIDLLTPLLKAQDYLEDVRQIDWFDKSDTVQCNLSEIRNQGINTSSGDLRRWYFYILPELVCDLSKQYIFIDDAEKDFAKGKIVICRTERYLNEQIDYSFLKDYEEKLIFSGTMREYNTFCMQFDLQIPKLNISNFSELAQALKQSNGLISNQTMVFQIAEGLKINRAVEVCYYANNVIPTGANGYDFYAQQALEYYFHIMNGSLEGYKEKIKAFTNAKAFNNQNKEGLTHEGN